MSVEIQAATTAITGPVTVLVVEDETLIRLLGSDTLRDEGFDVVTAASAAEAIAVLESGGRVDFVFTDVTMPGAMNGVGLANWIRVLRPGLPFAVTSGVPRLRLFELGLRDEDTYVAKPVDFAVLVRHIRSVVAARTPV